MTPGKGQPQQSHFMERVQPCGTQPLEERMAVDSAMVTLHGQKYPSHQELPVLSHSSGAGVQVALDPPLGTTFPISLHTLRRLFCHSFKRLTFFSTDFPNSPANYTPQWHELFSSVRIR